MSFLSSILGGGKPQKVQPLPTAQLVQSQRTPTKDAAAESAAAELKKRQQRAASQGMRSTILTQESSTEGTLTKRNTVLGA